MVKILHFLNGEPAKVVSYVGYQKIIPYFDADRHPQFAEVKIIFATFNNGSNGAVLVASDRDVTHEDILNAHERLIVKKRKPRVTVKLCETVL